MTTLNRRTRRASGQQPGGIQQQLGTTECSLETPRSTYLIPETDLHEGDSQGISPQQLDGRGGDRGHIKRTELPLQRQLHSHVALLCQLAARHRCHAHQLGAFRLRSPLSLTVLSNVGTGGKSSMHLVENICAFSKADISSI